MSNEFAERDRLWCKALIETLGVDDIAKVTAHFNQIRPDKPDVLLCGHRATARDPYDGSCLACYAEQGRPVL